MAFVREATKRPSIMLNPILPPPCFPVEAMMSSVGFLPNIMPSSKSSRPENLFKVTAVNTYATTTFFMNNYADYMDFHPLQYYGIFCVDSCHIISVHSILFLSPYTTKCGKIK